MFCGSAAEGAAVTNVKVTNSRLKVDTEIMVRADDCNFGLICGRGEVPVEFDGVTCEKVGENLANINLVINEDGSFQVEQPDSAE